ncbi:MAG: hypothetical protein E7055_13525 [Lentisphaerae bacterium]|nr:hypothetical protein [Lentisphaerota bacterium]
MEFYEDGAFNQDLYRKAPVRIVWILKEALDYDRFSCQKECFEDAFKKEGLGPTWGLMAYVAHGILNIKEGKYLRWEDVPLHFEETTGSADSLKHIAAINAKKTPNNSSSGISVDKEIRSAFENNKELIFKQLDDLNPQILIFGYPEALKPIVEAIYRHFENESYIIHRHIGSIAETINKTKSRIYLWGYHPSHYKSEDKQCSYYQDILLAVSDYLQSNRDTKL